MIHLYIKTGNAAFEGENKNLEVARIVAEAAEKVGSVYSGGVNLRDYNGNIVGEFVKSDDQFTYEAGIKYVTLAIDTVNSAFEGDEFDYECARIMRGAADKIRDGDLCFKLRDVNGNCVGAVVEVEGKDKSGPGGDGGVVAPVSPREPGWHVYVNSCDFGLIKAKTEQEARDKAAQMAGYKNEADMELQIDQPSEIVANLEDDLNVETIKSIVPVLLNGEWVVRARLSNNDERFKGIGAGYNQAQAYACSSARGVPRVGDAESALDEDREPNMEARNGSSEGMPSCWTGGKQKAFEALCSSDAFMTYVNEVASIKGARVSKEEFGEVMGGRDLHPFADVLEGKVIALDSKVGFVLQSKGRGEARVFMADTLSRIPPVGEMMKVSFKDGKGIVADSDLSKDKGCER